MSVVIVDDYQKVKGAKTETYVSLPWMTKYEFDQVIGLRTMHLSKGAPPMIDLPADFHIKRNMELREVAITELQQKRLPYIIKRTLPNGKIEYWPVSALGLQAIVPMMRRGIDD